MVVVTALVYAPTRSYDFVDYDDCVYVSGEPRVRSGLTREGIRWALTDVHANFRHPVTTLSLMLDSEIWGPDNAGGFHLSNVVLHCANVAALFLVLHAMTGALWRSAFAAALFAWHPLHVESVAWVSQRKDVLSTLFWILAVGAYLGYARRPGWARYSGLTVCFALGLLAKPMLVTLPFALLLLDFWPLKRFDPAKGARGFPRSLIWEKLPLLALAVLAGVEELRIHDNERIVPHALSLRLANATVNYVSYLSKTLWPAGLSFYPYRMEVPAWQVLGAIAVLAALTVLAFAARRRNPSLLVGWLWYIGTLAPVCGIVQVAEHSMADRYTYVPLIGVFLMAAWALPQVAPRRTLKGVALSLGAAAVLVGLLAGTVRQIRHWRDSAALWEHAVSVAPGNATAMNNLAWIRATDSDPGNRDGAQAVLLARKAIALVPVMNPAYLDTLAAALAESGRFEEAVRVAEAALAQEVAHHDGQLAPAIETRLDLYRRGRPFRE